MPAFKPMQFEHSVQNVEIMALELEPPVILDVSVPVAEVVRTMRERGEGYAILTDQERLKGIFTERDVLRKVVAVAGVGERPISDFMSHDPVCVEAHEPVRGAILHMFHGGFRHVPVVDSDKHVVGCVRHKDLARYVVQHFPDRILNLPPEPDQVATSPEGG